MNSKQRRQRRRRVLKDSKFWLSMTKQMLDDLESGEYTVAELREQLNLITEVSETESKSEL